MSDQKWTRGPWISVYEEGWGEAHISTADRDERSLVEIATIGVDYTGPIGSEQRANAVLIAAAPDLYEALRALRDAVAAMYPKYGRDVEDAVALANGALAKARGK